VAWPTTRLTELLGVEYPIVQAPMASVNTPELVAAVSNAGGLGSYGGAMTPPDELREVIRRIRELTDRPFAVNLFAYDSDPEPPAGAVTALREHLAPQREELGLETPDVPERLPLTAQLDAQLDVIAEERVPVFSFTFGIPDFARVKEAGALVFGTATTPDEAAALETAGVDSVIAQGAEAGGHRGAFLGDPEDSLVGLFALVPQVADRVSVPVMAAGAIMDGRGIAAALTLGADAAALGTAYLVCAESAATDTHRRRVAEAQPEATKVTRAYTGRAARAVRTSFISDLESSGLEVLPFPAQGILTRPLGAASRDPDGELSLMLTGQGGALARPMAAGELTERLAAEAGAILAGRGG
jgi:nitronate monooxygenase